MKRKWPLRTELVEGREWRHHARCGAKSNKKKPHKRLISVLIQGIYYKISLVSAIKPFLATTSVIQQKKYFIYLKILNIFYMILKVNQKRINHYTNRKKMSKRLSFIIFIKKSYFNK